jgi:hypothetical protein
MNVAVAGARVAAGDEGAGRLEAGRSNGVEDRVSSSGRIDDEAPGDQRRA